MNFGPISIENHNNNYTIKDSDSNLFHILIESLQLPFKTSFFSTNVCTLQQLVASNTFTIYTADKLLLSLYNQINILQNNNVSISYLNLSDILVIDQNIFLILNIDKLYFIQPNNHLLITEIYNKNNPYLSPLLINNNSIPFTSHKNDFLYNLALIVIDCFRKGNYLFTNLSNNQILDYFKYTKIFQTLKLCLNDDISNRLFIIF